MQLGPKHLAHLTRDFSPHVRPDFVGRSAFASQPGDRQADILVANDDYP